MLSYSTINGEEEGKYDGRSKVQAAGCRLQAGGLKCRPGQFPRIFARWPYSFAHSRFPDVNLKVSYRHSRSSVLDQHCQCVCVTVSTLSRRSDFNRFRYANFERSGSPMDGITLNYQRISQVKQTSELVEFEFQISVLWFQVCDSGVNFRTCCSSQSFERPLCTRRVTLRADRVLSVYRVEIMLVIYITVSAQVAFFRPICKRVQITG